MYIGKYILKIIGLRLLVLIMISMIVYSSAIAYIGGTLVETITFLQEEPVVRGDYKVLSLYSGMASLPITGILPPDLDRNLRYSNITGVIGVWKEIATPALVNGTLLIVRGLSDNAYNFIDINIVDGDVFGPNEPFTVLVGEGLARKLGLKPGDILVIDPLFTKMQAIVEVSGIIKTTKPYNWEIITNLYLARALRGGLGYTTLRIIYDPYSVDMQKLVNALGIEVDLDRVIFHQAVILLSKGMAELRDPTKLQSYYMERLGISPEYIFVSGVVTETLLGSLIVLSAWTMIGYRRDSFSILVAEGLPACNLRLYMLVVTLPVVFLAIIVGLYIASLFPSTYLFGYPLKYNPSNIFIIIDIVLFLMLYIVGVFSSEIEN